MDRLIENKRLEGTIEAPESKAYAHRYLIASALSNFLNGSNQSNVVLKNKSDDILATEKGIKAILEAKEGETAIVECHDSGSTLRFLLPIAAALGKNVKFMMNSSLSRRPTEELYHALKIHGAGLKELEYEDAMCIRVRDNIYSGEYEIPGNVSVQFVSGLLFALPLLNGDSTLVVTGELQMKSFVDMTLKVLEEAGISVRKEEALEEDSNIAAVFRIHGNQKYDLKGSVHVEGDWANASLLLAAGALSGPVTCTGLKMNTRQGDIKCLEILKEFGADVKVEDESVTVSKGDLKGISVDIVDNPYLAPMVELLGRNAEGKTEIINSDRMKAKENNHIGVIKMILNKVYEDTAKDIIEIDCFGDHRFAMMAAVASCTVDKPIKIIGAEAVKKSYPNFFEKIETLQK